MSIGIKEAVRPEPDQLLVDIADYVLAHKADRAEARDTARYCLMDTLGCGLLALNYLHHRWPGVIRTEGPGQYSGIAQYRLGIHLG